jgi:hypothetical protein
MPLVTPRALESIRIRPLPKPSGIRGVLGGAPEAVELPLPRAKRDRVKVAGLPAPLAHEPPVHVATGEGGVEGVAGDLRPMPRRMLPDDRAVSTSRRCHEAGAIGSAYITFSAQCGTSGPFGIVSLLPTSSLSPPGLNTPVRVAPSCLPARPPRKGLPFLTVTVSSRGTCRRPSLQRAGSFRSILLPELQRFPTSTRRYDGRSRFPRRPTSSRP